MTDHPVGGTPPLRPLILIPALITLAVTLLRLIGERRGWSPTLFSREAGGGLAIVGIVWLVPVFGIYLAVKLIRMGQAPASIGRALGVSLVALLIIPASLFLGAALRFPQGGRRSSLLVAVASIAALLVGLRAWQPWAGCCSPTAWPRAFRWRWSGCRHPGGPGDPLREGGTRLPERAPWRSGFDRPHLPDHPVDGLHRRGGSALRGLTALATAPGSSGDGLVPRSRPPLLRGPGDTKGGFPFASRHLRSRRHGVRQRGQLRRARLSRGG